MHNLPSSSSNLDRYYMSHKCEISGNSRQVGHRVSHAKNRTKHVFKANLQTKMIFVPELGKSIRLKVSTRVIRTIDRIGLANTLKKFNLKLNEISG